MFQWIHRKCREREDQLRADLADAHVHRLEWQSNYNLLTIQMETKVREARVRKAQEKNA